MKSMYKTVLIDDETNSVELLEWQIARYCPSLKIVAQCKSARSGIEAIHQHRPDLVFLDIQMPEMNGFELLEQLNPIQFDVIFTTAHDEFAIKAFKVHALDYLLKPIDIEELQIAVRRFEQKAEGYAHPEKIRSEPDFPRAPKRIALTTPDSLIFMQPDKIVYCEGDRNYTNFHLTEGKKKIVVAKTLKEVEEILVSYGFFRIHHSYLVNLAHILEFRRGSGGHVVMSNGSHLTVSRTKKIQFFETFSKF
jgi:two-component system, LytTR family, response regulator